jgi:predicted membrane-bound spermidine synthase
MRHALLFSVFVVASCGLAYELVAASLSSYVLGDSITQFSTVIGTYLFAGKSMVYPSHFMRPLNYLQTTICPMGRR